MTGHDGLCEMYDKHQCEAPAAHISDRPGLHRLQVASKAANEKKRKPQPTVRERLAKKLLSGKARGRTLGEMESAADARFQEVNSNQWKATRFP